MIKSLLCIAAVLAFLWTPAGRAAEANALDGKWHIIFDTQDGTREFNAMFEVADGKVGGKWDVDGAKTGGTPIVGTLAGKDLTLEFPFDSPEVGPGTLKLKGAVADDGTMSGTWAFQEYSGNFKAARIKAKTAK